MADMPGLKCLVFDGAKIEAELRTRFPMMDAATLREVVVVAAEVVNHLWHGREARIAQRGEDWRRFDSLAEIVAFAFNMESATNADRSGETTRVVNTVISALHAAYCNPEEHQGTPSMPPDMRPPGGGGFKN